MNGFFSTLLGHSDQSSALQDNIPIPIHFRLPPRRDYDRRVKLLHNQRASQRLPHEIRPAQNTGVAFTRARPKIRASHDLWATRSVHRPRKTLPQLAKPHAPCRRGGLETYADDGNRIVLTAIPIRALMLGMESFSQHPRELGSSYWFGDL